MPDRLVNKLKNRQRFLDLLRYVLGVRERGPADRVAITNPVGKRRLSSELEGVLLIQELNCVACHESHVGKTGIAARKSPNLNWSRQRLNPRYLAKFIADPHGMKPGTTMPDVLGHLGKEASVDSANAISPFLQTNINDSFRSQKFDADSVSRGSDLFHTVGCVACHAPRDTTAREMPLAQSIPLGVLSQKYSINAMVDFLKDPHAVRPSGRMPNLNLNHHEATDIAGYLLQNASQEVTEWTSNATLANQGKLLFSVLGCASCHTHQAVVNRQILRPPALEKSNPRHGCLSGTTGRWPNFHFSNSQLESIRLALKKAPFNLTGEQ